MTGVFRASSIVARDRKSTRLNSSHGYISYAVFFLKKKQRINIIASLEGTLNPRRLKTNHTDKQFMGGINSSISTNRNNLIIGVDRCIHLIAINKTNQTGKKFRVGIKSNISSNRYNLISGVDRCIHVNAMKKTTITRIIR